MTNDLTSMCDFAEEKRTADRTYIACNAGEGDNAHFLLLSKRSMCIASNFYGPDYNKEKSLFVECMNKCQFRERYLKSKK